MAFVIFGMFSLLLSVVTLMAWASVAMLFGIPTPSPDQATGVLLGWGALSQIAAAVGSILWN